MSAVNDVQTYLVAQGIIDGSTGWPSVRRNRHDQTDKLVVISEDGGPPPEFPAAQGLGSAAIKNPGVLVLVRGEPYDGDGAVAKAQAILDALHGLVATTLGDNTYIGVRSLTPEPIFAGADDNKRPLFTTSFRLMADVS